MSVISRLRAVDESEKSLAVEKLVSASTPDFDFFLMIVLSILMASRLATASHQSGQADIFTTEIEGADSVKAKQSDKKQKSSKK